MAIASKLVDSEFLLWEPDRFKQAVLMARLQRVLREIAPPDTSDKSLVKALKVLDGVGPKVAESLIESGITSPGQLVYHFPFRYLDCRNPKEISSLSSGMGQVVCVGISESVKFVRRGKGMRWLQGTIRCRVDSAVKLRFRWFNAFPSMQTTFAPGKELVLEVNLKDDHQLSCANPRIVDPSEAIACVYRDLGKVKKKTLKRSIKSAVALAPTEIPILSPELERSLELPSITESIETLHDPPVDLSEEEFALLQQQNTRWHRRVSLEMAIPVCVSVERKVRNNLLNVAAASPPVPSADIYQMFPFELTESQKQTIAEISSDLASKRPMNRLLQGDVGAGKTAVAFAAAVQVVRDGGKVCLMAPTEVLAEQHFATISSLADKAKLSVALLCASLPGPVKRTTLARIAAGHVDLVVGTHSLLSKQVQIPDLRLAIVDEQHRFGARQRVRLRGQDASDLWPHMLVMTATPIPRTLALTLYGDLEVSTMTQMPSGRIPIKTKIAKGPRRNESAGVVIKKALAAGEKGFVVCPMIEPSEKREGWANVEESFAGLTTLLGEGVVRKCHGRLPLEERSEAIAALRSGEARLLVATTVIEVGVDIPSASIMVILDADRFGLAQLHQLRGRVGRSDQPSKCLLVASGNPTEDGMERLESLAASTDGFALAEIDLQMRGPGELLGEKQSGLPSMPFGGLDSYLECVEQAKGIAQKILSDDPELSKPQNQRLFRLVAGVSAMAGEAG